MHPQKMSPMRTKGKDKKNERLRKLLLRGTNCTSRPDLSSLCKPIDTSVSDLHQVSGLLEDGTDEIKSILSYECNVIYECRICHGLFRSIVNLVSHKRQYCKEKFDITHLHRQVFNNYNWHCSRESVMHMYKTEETSNDDVKNDRILRSHVSKESNKKDLSAIIHMLNKKQEEHMEKELENENAAASNAPDDQHIYLEAIDTNCSAVYQTIKPSNAANDTADLMKEQIMELHNMMDQNTIPLERQLEKSDSPIQANMSDEENELLIHRLPINDLSCSICNAKFSTKKTLTFHVKMLHTSKRLCYPCPCCKNTFANTWSVYRHLYKVHKKTNEQVRKLRPQIQEKAFHRKTPAIKDIKDVCPPKALENEMKNQTQELISHTESNTKLCNRSGRRRKPPLTTYLQCCKTPIAACDDTTIRIRKCNKLLDSISDNISCATDVDLADNTIMKSSNDKNVLSKNSNVLSSSDICDDQTFFRVQNVSSLTKEEWDLLDAQSDYVFKWNLMVNNNVPNITSSQNIDNSDSLFSAENQDSCTPEKQNFKSPNIARTDANEVNVEMGNKKEKASGHHSEKQLIDLKERDKTKVEEDNSKLQSSHSTSPNEKNRASPIESKIATIGNKNLKSLDVANEVNFITWKMKNKKERASGHHSEKQLIDSKKRDEIRIEEDNSKLQSSCSTLPNEKNRASSIESKIATIGNENLKSSDVANKVNFTTWKIKNKKERASGMIERDKIRVKENNSKLQSSCSTLPKRKNRLSLIQSKIAAIANFRKLRCLLCKRKFTSVPNLRRHVAMHIGWNRYSCKMCDFKCFVKCDCIAHCNKVHNMQNNRTAIAEMVLEIPQDEYTCSEDVITIESNPKTKSDNPDDITNPAASLCQPETRVDLNDSSDFNTYVSSQSEATDEPIAKSHASVERLVVDAANSDEAVKMQVLLDGKKSTDDPEFKRMIMEVIFGSIDTSMTEQAKSDKTALETSDDGSGRVNANNNINNTTIIDQAKEASRPILNKVKLQRPMRKRIRPLSKDFVYNLKRKARIT